MKIAKVINNLNKKKIGVWFFANISKTIKDIRNLKKDLKRGGNFLKKSPTSRNCIFNIYNFYRVLKIALKAGSLTFARDPSVGPGNKKNHFIILNINIKE